jgi:hypothetical protein
LRALGGDLPFGILDGETLTEHCEVAPLQLVAGHRTLFGKRADALGVLLRQRQLLLLRLHRGGEQIDVPGKVVAGHAEAAFLNPSPVALALDLGLEIAVLAVELRGDFRLLRTPSSGPIAGSPAIPR